MRSRDLREEIENLFDCEVERYHCASVASRYAFLDEVVLCKELFLHRTPNDLQQIFLLAQMLFDFLV